MMLFRRRTPYAQYPAGGVARAARRSRPGGYGPGYGPAPMGGGIGSGIAGGLASGWRSARAWSPAKNWRTISSTVAGGGGVIPAAEAAEPGASNGDMGGSDFGCNDPGSWEDGGGGGGGDRSELRTTGAAQHDFPLGHTTAPFLFQRRGGQAATPASTIQQTEVPPPCAAYRNSAVGIGQNDLESEPR